MADAAQNIITLDEGWNKQIKVVALDPLEVNMSIRIHFLFTFLKSYCLVWNVTLDHARGRLQEADQTLLKPRIRQSVHVRRSSYANNLILMHCVTFC